MKATQREFLRAIIDHPVDIREIAFLCGMRLSSASMVRNSLLAEGFIAPWSEYDEPIRITAAGRAAAEA